MHFMAAGGLNRAGAGALTLRIAPLLHPYELYCVVSQPAVPPSVGRTRLRALHSAGGCVHAFSSRRPSAKHG